MLPYAPWLGWLIPILGATLTIPIGAIRRKTTSYLAVLSIGLGAIFTFSLIPDILAGYTIDLKFPLLNNGLGVLVDPLSVLMACVITCIGLLVAVFSTGFMKEESSLARFWFLIQLFIGGYVIIVMADNLLFMFIGWEIVGVCCAGLAAFWHKNPQRAHIGLKTFLILHVADVLLLASILIIHSYSKTLNIAELSADSNWMMDLSKSGLLFATSIMFFGGAIGKAAQFPLQEWLPDALAASPSSFNALTECLAGPFLIARVLPIFHKAVEPPLQCSGMISFFLVVAFVGAITAVISGLIAIVQIDIFRVLSYGISSVIGYMIAALGLAGLMADWRSGYLAGTFLLTIDAFLSALLFLTAAYIFYAVGSENLYSMGGFKSRLAHRGFEVGALALAGIPPLSGFWCTNWIQTVAWDSAHEAGISGQLVPMISSYIIFALLIVGAGITAFYGLRMMGLVFGKKQLGSGRQAVRQPPTSMRVSLAATLAITMFLDFLVLLLIPGFNRFLLPLSGYLTFENISEVLLYIVPSISTVLTCVAVIVGGYPAYKLYVAHPDIEPELMERTRFSGKGFRFLRKRCLIDTAYYKLADGVHALSNILHAGLESGIDALNRAIASSSKRVSDVLYKHVELNIDKLNIGTATFFKKFSGLIYRYPELKGFEALNYFIAQIVTSFARRFRKTHTGILSYNMMTAFIGVILLIVLLLLFGGVTS